MYYSNITSATRTLCYKINPGVRVSILHIIPYTGWIAVQRGVKINHDLENSPLQIKTDSVVGSDEKVIVYFYTVEGDTAGGIALYFKSPSQYFLPWCSASWTTFPTSLPTEKDKIWTITLNKISGIRLIIHCNSKEVLNVVLSDTICGYRDWSSYWSRDVGKIKFTSTDTPDTASDYYRPGKFNLCFYLC